MGTRTGVGVRPVEGSWYISGVGEKPFTPAPAAVTKACGSAEKEDGTPEEEEEAREA